MRSAILVIHICGGVAGLLSGIALPFIVMIYWPIRIRSKITSQKSLAR